MFMKNPIDRWISATRSLNTGRIAWNTALGSSALRGVPLQVLGLGEGELQLLGERPGEVVAADRDVPLPDAKAVGHDQVGRFGAQREDHADSGGFSGSNGRASSRLFRRSKQT